MYTEILINNYIKPLLIIENQVIAVKAIVRFLTAVFLFTSILIKAVLEQMSRFWKSVKDLKQALDESGVAYESATEAIRKTIEIIKSKFEQETNGDDKEESEDDIADDYYETIVPIYTIPKRINTTFLDTSFVSEESAALCEEYIGGVPQALGDCYMVRDPETNNETALLYLHSQLPNLFGIDLPVDACDRFYTKQELKVLLKPFILEAALTNPEVHLTLNAIIKTIDINLIQRLK